MHRRAPEFSRLGGATEITHRVALQSRSRLDDHDSRRSAVLVLTSAGLGEGRFHHSCATFLVAHSSGDSGGQIVDPRKGRILMALSKTPVQAVDTDDIEQQIREIVCRNDENRLIAELARIVGRNIGEVPVTRASTALVEPIDRDKNDEESGRGSAPGFGRSAEQGLEFDGPAEQGLEFDGPAEQDLDDEIEPRPDELVAPSAPGKPIQRRPYALGLAVAILLVALGAVVAAAMRVWSVDGSGSEARVINSENAAAQEAPVAAPERQTPSPSMGASGPSPELIDVVGTTTPAPRDTAVIPSPPTTPAAAADEPLPAAPQSEALNLMFGTPHRVFTLLIKPDLDPASPGKPELAPLPPIKPNALSTTATATRKAAHTAIVSHSRQSGKNDAR
jgi:hypothetical protein